MGNPAPHRARKRFGQHFLHDHNIIRKMLSAIRAQPGQSIIEIGPGQGALTFPLLRECHSMTAIELDRDLIGELKHRAETIGELNLVNQDVLSVDLESLKLAPPLRIVGNLPYNISTPLMFHLLQHSELITDMHFMVQKEVALRIVARADDKASNSKHYGRLSVMMQYHCDTEYLFDVPPGCFSPPPKVDSAVIRLRPHDKPPVSISDVSLLETVVQTAFAQRRKTITNSLKNILDKGMIRSLDIDPGVRAEKLTLQEFARITEAVKELS